MNENLIITILNELCSFGVSVEKLSKASGVESYLIKKYIQDNFDDEDTLECNSSEKDYITSLLQIMAHFRDSLDYNVINDILYHMDESNIGSEVSYQTLTGLIRFSGSINDDINSLKEENNNLVNEASQMLDDTSINTETSNPILSEYNPQLMVKINLKLIMDLCAEAIEKISVTQDISRLNKKLVESIEMMKDPTCIGEDDAIDYESLRFTE